MMSRRLTMMLLPALAMGGGTPGCGSDEANGDADGTAAEAPAPRRGGMQEGEGGDAATRERTVRMLREGCDWLASQQNEDGTWGTFQPDVGITGLVVTALARADKDRYAEAIERGIETLMSARRADGAFSPDGEYVNYRTCVSIVALVAVDPERYADAIRKGREVILAGQGTDPDDWRNFGGFGYVPLEDDGAKHSDANNTGFAMEALRTVEDAGLGDIPEDVLERVRTFQSRLQNRTESNDLHGAELDNVGNDGGMRYRIDETKANDGEPVEEDGRRILPAYGSITYLGLLTMIYAEVDPSDPRVQAAYRWAEENYTLEENPGMAVRANPAKGQEGLYYYFHTMAKALSTMEVATLDTPEGPRNWVTDLLGKLDELARTDEEAPGRYWMNDADRWWEADPVLVTTYVTLGLERVRDFLEEDGR